jgi:fermentation-respiration switch protein FrsA (DUF1100 family)
MKKNLFIILSIVVWLGVGIIIERSHLFHKINGLIFPGPAYRQDIRNMLGIGTKNRKIPYTEVLESVKIADNVIRKKIHLKFDKYAQSTGFLFHPADITRKYPAVLVLHGHGSNIEDTAINEDSPEKALAKVLALNGFVTFTFDFSELERSLNFTDHKTAVRMSILMGKPVLGLYVWAGLRSLDFLCSLDYVDEDSIGAAGTSLGGHVAVYIAALDLRVKSIVDAAYFLSYSELLYKYNCVCNYIPGSLYKYDFPITASSISPRPALYMVGKNDESLSWEMSKKLFDDTVVPRYEKCGKKGNARFFLHGGAHEMQAESALNWFNKTL